MKVPIECLRRVAGSNIKCSAPAQRVIALAPHLTELLFTAGAGDRLVGVVEFSDFPVAASGLAPNVGDAFRLDYEAIAALEPDLILGWASGTPTNVLARLRDLGYRVVALEPGRLDAVAEHLRVIGRLVGTAEQAETAAAEYERELLAFAGSLPGRCNPDGFLPGIAPAHADNQWAPPDR